MSYPVRFTKTQLITQWLMAYPEDWNNPDLVENAIAGYIEDADGLFRWANHHAIKPVERKDRENKL